MGLVDGSLFESVGLIYQTSGVFEFLRSVFDLFPVAVKLLIYGSFGGVVFIAIARGLGR